MLIYFNPNDSIAVEMDIANTFEKILNVVNLIPFNRKNSIYTDKIIAVIQLEITYPIMVSTEPNIVPRKHNSVAKKAYIPEKATSNFSFLNDIASILEKLVIITGKDAKQQIDK